MSKQVEFGVEDSAVRHGKIHANTRQSVIASKGPWEKSYPACLQNYSIDDNSLPEGLDRLPAMVHENYGDKPAFTLILATGAEASLSFAQIDTLSDAFARYLVGHIRLNAGDVVAVQLPNSLHYPVTVFGAWKAGVIVTNVNPLYTEREVELQLRDSGAKLLVASNLFMQVGTAAAASCGVPLLVAELWDFFPAPVSQAIRAQSSTTQKEETEHGHYQTFSMALELGRGHDPLQARRCGVALYQYTGGTTGRSKGAVLTHRNILSALRMFADFNAAFDTEFTSRDTILTALPLYHIFAFVMNFLMPFRTGGRNILIPNPRPIDNLRVAFERFPITVMTGVDTLYAALLDQPWFVDSRPPLRYAASGGTALRSATGTRWREMISPMAEGYGLTETSCLVAFNPPGKHCKEGSVGLPLPGSEVRVIDAAGQDVPLGERGELIVRGPHIMTGYKSEDPNEQGIVDGWFYSGDIVIMDPEGFITIVDRKKDMVLVSGFNVYPNEIEDVIATHPDVLEVAVIGRADEVTGEAVVAFVVPRGENLQAEDIIRHCRSQLTAYKVPKSVVFRKNLPKSPVGKILRAQVRDLISETVS
jgi:long-chain acyl-CoA synthetase